MDIFKNFKIIIKIRQVLIDNEVFQLHYRVTALMLLASAALVASKQHFGDPIDCITKDDVPNKIMDTYCWIHATFTLPSACNKTVGVEVPHPCVDKYVSDKEDRVYHKYYQWVYFVLFFQAAFFYAPHFFWKICESSLLSSLTNGLRSPLKKDKDRIKSIAKCFVSRTRVKRDTRHKAYFYYFTLCEIMNFLNVIVQMYVVDEFLGGTFTTYGLDVVNYAQLEQDERVDPMVKVFPRMTKCSFFRFGASGDVQKYDALCILPLNIINEKIYIIMWFWFVFLAIVSGFWLIYRLLTFTKSSIRYNVIMSRARLVNSNNLRFILKKTNNGDWFVLSMICKNIDSQQSKFLIHRIKCELIAKIKEENRQKVPALLNNNNNNLGLINIEMPGSDEKNRTDAKLINDHSDTSSDNESNLSNQELSEDSDDDDNEETSDEKRALK